MPVIIFSKQLYHFLAKELEYFLIPKIIHYVWVGDNPKPESVLKCIDSWKRFLPDYQIIEWGNDKHESLKNSYSQQAYELKKWAFVSDYLRIYALYHHGGIYLDTDIEITHSLNNFLHHDFFSGHEIFNGKCLPVLTALMGCKPGHPFMRDILAQYNSEEFVTRDGINTEPNTYRFTQYFEHKFDVAEPYSGDKILTLEKEAIIYPTHYFCTPQNDLPNFAIHHFDGSWEYGYKRRNKLTCFSGYKIVRFRRQKHIESLDLPLTLNEKILLKIKLRKDVLYCLTKTS